MCRYTLSPRCVLNTQALKKKKEATLQSTLSEYATTFYAVLIRTVAMARCL
jgi:hypothetical protein